MKKYLPFREKLAYGFGDLASVLYWQTFMLYFTYFYTDIFLMPAAAAATMFLVSRLVDGFNDPIMGIIADRTNTRWGKFRPYLLWFAVPFAVIGVFTFTVPDFSQDGKIIWAYCTFLLIMILYTVINIPYTSLLGVISPNSAERTTVSSVKFIFAFAAGIIISATLLPMTQILGEDDDTIMAAEISNDSLIVHEKKRGVSTFSIQAQDEEGKTNIHEIRFTVTPTENNTPRIKNPISEISLQNNFNVHTVDISEFFEGSTHNNFTYTVENTSPELFNTKVENSQLIITENSNEAGNGNIKLIAHDEKWGEKSISIPINIMAANNTAPILVDSTDNIVLDNGFTKTSIQLNSLFYDKENDDLSYFVESSNNDVISPLLEDSVVQILEKSNGISNLTITAIDNKGGRSSHTIQFTIRNPNDNNAPFIVNKQTGFEVYEGFETHAIALSDFFHDIDNQNITYELTVINEAKGWSRFFMIIGAAAVIFFFIAFKGTKERVQPSQNQNTSIKNDLKQLITNGPWLILLATTITFILFVAVRGSVTVHYFKYIIGHQTLDFPFFDKSIYDFNVLASIYNTVGQLSSLLGVFAVGWVSKYFGKIKTFIAFFIIAIISTASVFFLTAEHLGLIYFLQITGSFTGGPLSVLLWAMYADTADYSEWKNGGRATGLIFSASTMSQKIGWAVGAYLALTLMAQVGFEPNQLQSSESTKGLLQLFTLIPAGLGLVSIIIILFYPLNDKRVDDIEKELMVRRDDNKKE
ncbi:MAG: MFS transporter [Bacteroidales bacterium]